jgi:hypothetical protein
MFAMELDGEREAGTPLGPAFSTPYSERINAARSTISGSVLQQPFTPKQKPLDKAEALKAYLFSGHSYPSPAAPNQSGSNESGTSATNSRSLSTNAANGTENNGFLQRPQRAYPFHQETKSSNNIPRQIGRSSGLRQEVTSNSTPNLVPNHNNYYSGSPVIHRNPGNIPSYQSHTNGALVPYLDSQGSPNSVLSGGRNADLKGMEDGLRKLLKISSSETN